MPSDCDQAAPAASPTGTLDTLPAIEVDDLSISYRTLFESDRGARRRLSRARRSGRIDALTGVSFNVERGSVYGVIGRNGSGKSSLFRTIAGIMPPTRGSVTVRGRVTPLLSLGIGFNQSLTGRENIMIGGLANGMTREEVLDRMAAVMDFAELGEAIDRPCRTYSGGMMSRLGFAVTSHLDPDIILIDEALGAGDAGFRQKCTDKMNELVASDCTVLIVTHGLVLIRAVADRCLWLDGGVVRQEGEPEEVIVAYEEFCGIEDRELAEDEY